MRNSRILEEIASVCFPVEPFVPTTGHGVQLIRDARVGQLLVQPHRVLVRHGRVGVAMKTRFPPTSVLRQSVEISPGAIQRRILYSLGRWSLAFSALLGASHIHRKPMALAPGSRLGSLHEVTALIGKGGMG